MKTNEFKQLAACEAAMALSAKERSEALRVLVGLSHDSGSAVRSRAAECLTELGGEVAVSTLIGMMHDIHPKVRSMAMLGLADLRVYAVKTQLGEVLNSDESVPVRIVAARALGLLDDMSGLELLRDLLVGNDERIRRLAVMALKDVIGQRFSPDQQGIKAAIRYLQASPRLTGAK